jgi:hypothetical protein
MNAADTRNHAAANDLFDASRRQTVRVLNEILSEIEAMAEDFDGNADIVRAQHMADTMSEILWDARRLSAKVQE